MPIGQIYWMIMIVAFLFGVWANWGKEDWRPAGSSFIVFVLFFIVGWKLFGFVVQ